MPNHYRLDQKTADAELLCEARSISDVRYFLELMLKNAGVEVEGQDRVLDTLMDPVAFALQKRGERSATYARKSLSKVIARNIGLDLS